MCNTNVLRGYQTKMQFFPSAQRTYQPALVYRVRVCVGVCVLRLHLKHFDFACVGPCLFCSAIGPTLWRAASLTHLEPPFAKKIKRQQWRKKRQKKKKQRVSTPSHKPPVRAGLSRSPQGCGRCAGMASWPGHRATDRASVLPIESSLSQTTG